MPPMNVVHVEDERPLRDILGIAFRAAEPGINLQQFTSGDEALGYIEANGKNIDLFVLDIRLPGTLNGLQIARRVRDLQLPGYIVLTSAYQAPDHELLVSLHSEYYPKPWHLFELTEKLLKYRLSKPPAPVKEPAATDESTPVVPMPAVPSSTPTAAPTTVPAAMPATAPPAPTTSAPTTPAVPMSAVPSGTPTAAPTTVPAAMPATAPPAQTTSAPTTPAVPVAAPDALTTSAPTTPTTPAVPTAPTTPASTTDPVTPTPGVQPPKAP